MQQDHGFAWLVLLAAFICNILFGALCLVPSVFLVSISEAFEISTYQAGWVCSLNSFFISIVSIASGMLINKFSCRSLGFIGAIFYTLFHVISSQVNSVVWFVITFSVLGGISGSFTRLSPIVIIQIYFNKKRPFANGFAMTGYSTGSFLLLPLIGYWIQHYGWRGALMLVGGIALNMCICMLIFIPFNETKHEIDAIKHIEQPERKTFCELLTNKTFIMVATSFSCFMFGADVMFKVSTPRAELDYGIDKTFAASFTAIVCLAGLFSRLVSIFILGMPCVKPLAIYSFGIFLGGMILMASVFCTDYITLLLISSVYGIVFAMTHTVQTIVLVDLLGVDTIAKSQGLMGSMTSVVFLTTVPFSGYMYQVFGSFTNAYLIAGLVQSIGGVIAIVLFTKTMIEEKRTVTKYGARQLAKTTQLENKNIYALKANSVIIGSIENLSSIV